MMNKRAYMLGYRFGKTAQDPLDDGNSYWDNVKNMYVPKQIQNEYSDWKNIAKNVSEAPGKLGDMAKQWAVPVAGLGMAAVGAGMMAFGGNRGGGTDPKALKNAIKTPQYNNPFQAPELDMSKDGPWQNGVKTYS
jgi:hypothetical protein